MRLVLPLYGDKSFNIVLMLLPAEGRSHRYWHFLKVCDVFFFFFFFFFRNDFKIVLACCYYCYSIVLRLILVIRHRLRLLLFKENITDLEGVQVLPSFCGNIAGLPTFSYWYDFSFAWGWIQGRGKHITTAVDQWWLSHSLKEIFRSCVGFTGRV